MKRKNHLLCAFGIHEWMDRKTKYLPRPRFWQECSRCGKRRGGEW